MIGVLPPIGRLATVYVLSLLTLFFQFSVALGDPAPGYTQAEVQMHGYVQWGVIMFSSGIIVVLLFTLFRDKAVKAGWAAVPGALLGLVMPVWFLVFHIRNLVDAFH